MIGKTKIQVSQEQMCQIVQHWLEAKTLASFMKDTVVTSVSMSGWDINGFSIEMENAAEEQDRLNKEAELAELMTQRSEAG